MDSSPTGKPRLPVDHGWAWWVVVGYFINLYIIISWIRSLAILLPIFLDKYQQSTAVTTLAFGISELVESITHVLLSLLLLNRFSVRSLTLFGALANIFAIFSLYLLSSNIILLNLAFGVIGFARGFLLNPQIFLLGAYFKKRLSFASSIGNTGLSVATLSSPLITQLLLTSYGLEGTFLLFSAIATHSIISALLFRPTSLYNTKEVTHNVEPESLHHDKQIDNALPLSSVFHSSSSLSSLTSKSNLRPHFSNKIIGRPTDQKLHEKQSQHLLCEDEVCSTENIKTISRKSNEEKNTVTNNSKQEMVPNLSSDDLRKSEFKSETNQSFHKEQSQTKQQQTVSIWEVFRNPTAVLIILAGIFGVQTQCCAIYLPVVGLENGLESDQLPWLLTIGGCSDILGKMMFGFVADRKWLQPINIATLCMINAGLICQFISYFQGMASMVMLSILIGLHAGIIQPFLAPITVDHAGLPSLPHVTSGVFLGNCILTFLAHLVVGTLKDHTGSFYWGFRFVGALMLAAAVFLLMVRRWSTTRRRRVVTNQNSEGLELSHEDSR